MIEKILLSPLVVRCNADRIRQQRPCTVVICVQVFIDVQFFLVKTYARTNSYAIQNARIFLNRFLCKENFIVLVVYKLKLV